MRRREEIDSCAIDSYPESWRDGCEGGTGADAGSVCFKILFILGGGIEAWAKVNNGGRGVGVGAAV